MSASRAGVRKPVQMGFGPHAESSETLGHFPSSPISVCPLRVGSMAGISGLRDHGSSHSGWNGFAGADFPSMACRVRPPCEVESSMSCRNRSGESNCFGWLTPMLSRRPYGERERQQTLPPSKLVHVLGLRKAVPPRFCLTGLIGPRWSRH